MPPVTVSPGPIVARLRAAGCVFAEDEARLLLAAAGSESELADLVGRRVAGLPLEHVLGWAEFSGLRLAVAPGVFVPRHRTEDLVREAARLVLQADGASGAVVLDLCCGCGALGAALVTMLRAAGRPEREVHAADADPAAVECARRNLEPFGGRTYCGDLYAPLPSSLRGRVDVLLANVPYVPSEAIALMPPEARLHEPRQALDGGPDGLAVLRRVAADAPAWLAPRGFLLIECSERQAAAASEALADAGLDTRTLACEETIVLVCTRAAVTRTSPATPAPAPPGPAGPGG